MDVKSGIHPLQIIHCLPLHPINNFIDSYNGIPHSPGKSGRGILLSLPPVCKAKREAGRFARSYSFGTWE